MSGRSPRSDFTQNLEAVARGVRRLEEIRDPILRQAIATALRLHDRELRLDPASRVRMRNTVLAALAPARPTAADRAYGAFAVLGLPVPILVRALAIVVVCAVLLGGATVAGADSLPDDALYSFKVAGEQLRLAMSISPEDRAAVELSIAEHRLDEAERLAAVGREDDAIIATAAYGTSIAYAAAELASVESRDAGGAALVTQLQVSITTSQQRVAGTVTRLAADPRTAATAEVLATVAATPSPSKDSPAARIADQAVAITTRLASVADVRADLADPRGTEAARARVAPRTDAPVANVSATLPPPRAATVAPPGNASAARQAAEKAKEAAQKAVQAAEKARRVGTRTPSPSPTRR
jgi:hypothetical protein